MHYIHPCADETVLHFQINHRPTRYTAGSKHVIPLISVPVAQWLEHCVISAKVVGLIPREHTYRQYKSTA